MTEAIEQAGLRLAAARRHATACEFIANGIAWLTGVGVVMCAVGFVSDPKDVELLSVALGVFVVGGAWWALVRAAGLALHIRVDAVMVEAEDEGT